MHPPPFQDSVDLDLLPEINSILNNDKNEMESLANSNTRCNGLLVGAVLRNNSQGPCQSRRNEDENPQDLSLGAISLHLPPDPRTIPPLRRRQVSWFRLALNY